MAHTMVPVCSPLESSRVRVIDRKLLDNPTSLRSSTPYPNIINLHVGPIARTRHSTCTCTGHSDHQVLAYMEASYFLSRSIHLLAIRRRIHRSHTSQIVRLHICTFTLCGKSPSFSSTTNLDHHPLQRASAHIRIHPLKLPVTQASAFEELSSEIFYEAGLSWSHIPLANGSTSYDTTPHLLYLYTLPLRSPKFNITSSEMSDSEHSS